jgi:hypothetical protein
MRSRWTSKFSREVLPWLRKLTSQPSSDWMMRQLLKDLAMRLAPETLTEAFHDWPASSTGWEFWSKGVDEFLAVAQFRSDLHSALNLPK